MFWCRKPRFGLLLHSFSLLFAIASSQLVNITVDDQLGDPITGFVPQYLPNDVTVWHVGSPTQICKCNIKPDVLDLNQIHGKTWHDATPLNSPIPTTITFQFTGSAVYVFNIIPNTLPNSTITRTNITFTIDGTNLYTFLHEPDPKSDTILYNQLVYHNTGLEDGPHTLTMTPGDFSLILFDYLLYTRMASSDTTSASTTSTSTSSTNTGQSISSESNAPTTNTSTSNTPTSTWSASSSSTSESTNFTQSSSLQSSTPPSSARSSSSHIGTIAGAVVGGVVLLSAIAFGAFLLGRKSTHSKLTPLEQSYGAFPTQPVNPDATPASVTPWSDGAKTHNLLYRASNVSGQVTPRPSPVTADGVLTAGWSSKRRSELTQRLETLQRTRSILSSQPPTGPSRSEFSSEGGTEMAVRELEAEMAELRRVLATFNLQLADRGHDGRLEPLPEYME